MTHKNPLGKIKDVAAASLKVPVTVAGTAVDLAKGAVGSVVGGARDVAASGVGDHDDRAPAEESPDQPASQDAGDDAPAEEPKIEISPDEPVNVTEQLGLDPAPVDKPKPKKPLTKIDAAADPSEVDVTPADVARAVGQSDEEKSSGPE